MQVDDNPQINQLKKLKAKLESREMSTLIGAGFSKNIDDLFPTWWGLIYDMVFFLFGAEIEEDFVKLKKGSISKEEYFNSKIEYYITKVGYLELASMYIKQKGYREAITTYIEERTPKLYVDNNNDNKRYLSKNVNGKVEKIELTDEKLILHKAFINLPWNNIYTTNYDEMLEVASDLSTEKSLISLKNNLENELVALQEQKNDIIKRKSILNDELLELQTPKSSLIKNENDLEEDNLIPANYAIIKEKNDDLLKMEWDSAYNYNRSRDIEKELIDIQKALNECINVVTHSSQLSIKRNKNIIKLHGTLRKDGKFGFDNDPRLQYIIAKEDYETYPQKHEAFTQLMRISLLQESYCLIGFSGVDPNFIEWVKWVRDILEKRNHENYDYKIYLIEAGASKSSEDLKLFYENYRICKISLANPEVITFLEKETNLSVNDKTDKKELLKMFVNYLGGGSYSFSKVFLEQSNKSKYQETWNNLRNFSSKKVDLEALLLNYKIIINLKKKINLPNSEFAYTRNKTTFLYHVLDLLHELDNDNIKQEKILNLLFVAIDDLGICLSLLWDEDEILLLEKFSIKYSETKIKFEDALLNDSILRLDNAFLNSKFEDLITGSDELIFKGLIHLLLNFNFKCLKTEIEKWNPNSSRHIIQKAGLLSFFDLSGAEQLLQKNWNKFQEISIEEQLYYYEILRYYSSSHKPNDKHKSLNQKIINIKSLGFDDLYKKIKKLLDELEEKPLKLDRYGANRFSISNSVNFSNESSQVVKGIQIVNLLFNFGLPLSTEKSYFFNVNEWYKVFKAIFESYPYPAVFFTLQYSDEKMIRRIAQDFINSDHLIEETNYLLPKLLDLYQDSFTINRLKKSILLFCIELFVAVDPKIWQDKFLKILKLKNFQSNILDVKKDENHAFILSAIPYVDDVAIIRYIIDFSLINRKNNIATNILYTLNDNKTFKNLKTKISRGKLLEKIDRLIEDLINNEESWFLVGNIFDILSKSQKQLIKSHLLKIDYMTIKNVRLWRLFIIFSEYDKKILNLIKQSIIKNKELWNAGFIPSGGISLYHEFIVLHMLKGNKTNLWTKSEAILIYNRMVEELNKIENRINSIGGQEDFSNILQEMIYFLNEEKNKLKDIESFKEVNEKVLKFYCYNLNVIENIISDNPNEVKWGLSDLSYFLQKKNAISEKEKMLSALLNKIIFGNVIAIEACIACLVSYLKDNSLKKLFLNDFSPIIIILNKYSKNLPDNTEKFFMIKNMIKIAESLKIYSVKNEIIDYWIDIKEQKRYNY